MLKKILSPKKCAECKGCCYFDNTDFWEIPYVSEELAEYIRSNYKSVELVKINGMYKFRVPDTIKENEVFVCPMLSDNGCVLGDSKPFDCRIYPFRIMRDKNGAERIAMSSYCNAFSDMKVEDLKDFMLSSGLYDKIISYKKTNPDAVIDYTDSYTVIL